MWYGLKIGLDYNTVLDIPFRQLRNLISIEQIKHEGARQQVVLSDEEIWNYWGEGDE